MTVPRARILLPVLATLLALQAGAQAPARSLYIPYSDAQPILEALEDVLPAELKDLPAEQRRAAWPNFVKKRDAEIRARLAQGDEDSIVNLLLFGTSFTSQPRVTENDLARLAPGRVSRRSKVTAEVVGPVIQGRASDLVKALAAPGSNERLAFARQVVSRKGYNLGTAKGHEQARQFLYAGVARVLNEQAGWATALEEARRLGSATEEFAQRSRLYRDRGLSLDTSLRPNFAIDQTLAELKRRGLLAPGSVRRVAVIGPGLDFVDKSGGYDFYPEQTIQPFAVMDSLLRLGLAEAKGLEVTTLDLSPRVNAHVRRMRQRAAAGRSYTVQLPRETGTGWREEFTAYWQRFGDQVGVEAKPAALPEGVEGLAVRAVRIRAGTVLRVRAADLNAVLQRLEGAGYDLVVATNILVYYDLFEQSLALKNVERMVRPGGFLLSNNALLELPSSQMHSVGYLTTVYSSRADDGDHVVWYQKARE